MLIQEHSWTNVTGSTAGQPVASASDELAYCRRRRSSRRLGAQMLASKDTHLNFTYLTGIKCPVRKLDKLSPYLLAEFEYPREVTSKIKTLVKTTANKKRHKEK